MGIQKNNLYIKIGKLFTNIICISIIYSVESVYIYLNENGRKPPPQYKNVVVLEYLEISW